MSETTLDLDAAMLNAAFIGGMADGLAGTNAQWGAGKIARIAEEHGALVAEVRRLRAEAGDAARLDWVEAHGMTAKPDGMDGWLVRGRLVTSGMRNGYPQWGAHRLREAIDAAMTSEGR